MNSYSIMDSANSSRSSERERGLNPEPQQRVPVERDVIESADDVNLHEICNSKMTSDDTFINQEVITSKHGNCRVDNTEANSEPSKVEEICYIDRLPVEVLERIFYRYLSPKVRKSIRLVCRTWYYRSNRNVNMTVYNLKTLEASRDWEYLNNCGFESPNLQLLFVHFNQYCMPAWGNFWRRIHSLRLTHCRLRNRAFENIISHCDNLEYLEISLLQNDGNNQTADFCTFSTLESLDCVRPKLKTLKILNDVQCYLKERDCDFKKWERIFNRLVHIFPNVAHYSLKSTSKSMCTTLSKFEFSLESNEISDRSGLASCLFNAFCVDTSDTNNFSWRNALDALSASRLTRLSLALQKNTYTEEDKSTLFKFFSCHRPLKFIELNLSCRTYPWNHVYEEIVTSLIYQLLEFNPQLRALYYCQHVDWIMRLSDTEFKRFCSITPKLETLITDHLVFESSSISSPCNRVDHFQKMLSSCHPVHQHLSLRVCNDGILQKIFQYLTNLETLKIDFPYNVTNFGFTGVRENLNVGYSIKRLQNLKRLDLTPCTVDRIDDEVFNEFDFSMLNHLECFIPEKFSTLVLLGQKLPILSELVFVRMILSFSRPRMEWDTKSRVRLSSSNLKELFTIFPMLKSVSLVEMGNYPLTVECSRKVVFRNSNECSFRSFDDQYSHESTSRPRFYGPRFYTWCD